MVAAWGLKHTFHRLTFSGTSAFWDFAVSVALLAEVCGNAWSHCLVVGWLGVAARCVTAPTEGPVVVGFVWRLWNCATILFLRITRISTKARPN